MCRYELLSVALWLDAGICPVLDDFAYRDFRYRGNDVIEEIGKGT